MSITSLAILFAATTFTTIEKTYTANPLFQIRQAMLNNNDGGSDYLPGALPAAPGAAHRNR